MGYGLWTKINYHDQETWPEEGRLCLVRTAKEGVMPIMFKRVAHDEPEDYYHFWDKNKPFEYWRWGDYDDGCSDWDSPEVNGEPSTVGWILPTHWMYAPGFIDAIGQ